MRDIKYVTLNETCMETYQTPLKCNRRWNLNKNIKKGCVGALVFHGNQKGKQEEKKL